MLESDDLSTTDKNSVARCLALLLKNLRLRISPLVSVEEGVTRIFREFDRNNNLNITIDELHNLCIHVGVPLERK